MSSLADAFRKFGGIGGAVGAALLVAGCAGSSSSHSDFYPIYSADGQNIVFCSIPFDNGQCEIWTMRADGSGRRQVTHLWQESAQRIAAAGFAPQNAKGINLYPVLGPSGRDVSFVSVRRSEKAVTNILYSLDLETGALKKWFEVDAQRLGPLAWSPKRDAIVFVSDMPDNAYELWMLNAGQSAPVRLTSNRFHTWTPTWSAQEGIVYAGNRKSRGTVELSNGSVDFNLERVGQWELFRLDPTTGAQEPLTNNAHDDFSPSWAPDGRRLAYVSHVGTEWQLNIMDVATQKTQTVYRDSRYLDHVSWHPGGRRFLFTRGASKEFEGFFMGLGICSLDLDAGELQELSR